MRILWYFWNGIKNGKELKMHMSEAPTGVFMSTVLNI